MESPEQYDGDDEGEKSELADAAGYASWLETPKKVQLLETPDTTQRLTLLLDWARAHLAELEVTEKIRDEVRETMDKTQRYLMMALPVFFITFLLRFPMGLVIYWVTTNLWTVGQGLVTRRLVPRTAAAQAAAAQKRSSRTQPRSEQSADGQTKPKPAPASQSGGGGGGQSPPKRVKRKRRARR